MISDVCQRWRERRASYRPAGEPIDTDRYGVGARETRPEWIESLVEQCDDASVPVFVKQAAIDGRLVALPMVNGRVRADFPEVTRA